jgi:hypothetical protein
MKEEHVFCINCGKRVEGTEPPSTKEKTDISHTPETTTETVLGGFSSADIVRPGSFGYGIYITDRRVIGIKKPDQFAKSVGGSIAGAVIGKMLGFEAPWAVSSALGRSLSNDESKLLLRELEKNKDFEANRRDITLVQLKNSGLVSLGQLAIFLKGEQTTNIAIAFRKENVYKNLKDLFKAYLPKVLHII